MRTHLKYRPTSEGAATSNLIITKFEAGLASNTGTHLSTSAEETVAPDTRSNRRIEAVSSRDAQIYFYVVSTPRVKNYSHFAATNIRHSPIQLFERS
jgi:hypothetical protein